MLKFNKIFIPALFFHLFFVEINIAQTKSANSFKIALKPEEAGFSSQRLNRIDKLLTQYVEEGATPNAVTFIARHGKIVNFKT